MPPTPSPMLSSGLAEDALDVRIRPETGPVDAFTPRLHAALVAFLHRQAHENLAPDLTAELRALVLAGGKRLRPTFAWWAWRAAGGADTGADAETVVRALTGLELLQACALVHDDVMDRATIRRGRPTARQVFAAQHQRAGWAGDGRHFGDSAAILVGDLALAWADDALVTAGLPAAALARAWVPWRAMRIEMITGQHLDLLSGPRREESLIAALRVARLKTASYTVERPLHLGAALADAPQDLVAALREFGRNIGVAFQLRDDLLGVFGDAAQTGKPVGDDLRDGTRTPLMAIGISRAERAGRSDLARLLRECLAHGAPTEQNRDQLRAALRELGAVDEIERWISILARRGLAALDRARLAGEPVAALIALATRATARGQ